MKNRLRLLAIWALLLLLMTACGSSTAEPTPIPGWEKFEGSGAYLWLPESFEGGNLEEDLELIVGNMRALGDDFIAMADMIAANPGSFSLFVYDTSNVGEDFLTNVNITREQTLSGIDLDQFMDAISQQLPTGFNVVDRGQVELDSYTAGQMEIALDLQGIRAREYVYIIKDGTTFWAITYATGEDEFANLRSMFEQSANTFRVNEK